MMFKTVRLVVMTLAVVALVTNAWAFHDEGVAYCAGCHTMHNSVDGALVDVDSPGGNPWLLKDATASDVCLSCHATNHGAVFTGDPLNPPTEHGAGNFIFLTEDNINDGHNGALNPITGARAGHNIVAPGYGLAADAVLTSAPGGTYSSSILGCSSCHDPHGNANFRMLYGIGQIQGGLYTFTNPAPNADGINFRGAAESNTNHTAYKGGMSAWCSNCHGDFHNNNTDLIHPSGQAMGGTIAQTYNAYNGTDDMLGGTQATAYLAAVPFDDAGNTTASEAGPSASSQIMCLTCHRAHATSGPDIGRWDFHVTGLAEDGHESGSYPIPNPYGPTQRSLCNKCHAKDVNDAAIDFTP